MPRYYKDELPDDSPKMVSIEVFTEKYSQIIQASNFADAIMVFIEKNGDDKIICAVDVNFRDNIFYNVFKDENMQERANQAQEDYLSSLNDDVK